MARGFVQERSAHTLRLVILSTPVNLSQFSCGAVERRRWRATLHMDELLLIGRTRRGVRIREERGRPAQGRRRWFLASESGQDAEAAT